jgi:hypothetical protein
MESLKITNHTEEEMLDDQEYDERRVFEKEQAIESQPSITL